MKYLCLFDVVRVNVIHSQQAIGAGQQVDGAPAELIAEAQGGTIGEIEREDEDGQVVYEADVVVNGQEVELKVAADGKLIGKEVDDED